MARTAGTRARYEKRILNRTVGVVPVYFNPIGGATLLIQKGVTSAKQSSSVLRGLHRNIFAKPCVTCVILPIEQVHNMSRTDDK
jgi:hypothetical protein